MMRLRGIGVLFLGAVLSLSACGGKGLSADSVKGDLTSLVNYELNGGLKGASEGDFDKKLTERLKSEYADRDAGDEICLSDIPAFSELYTKMKQDMAQYYNDCRYGNDYEQDTPSDEALAAGLAYAAEQSEKVKAVVERIRGLEKFKSEHSEEEVSAEIEAIKGLYNELPENYRGSVYNYSEISGEVSEVPKSEKKTDIIIADTPTDSWTELDANGYGYARCISSGWYDSIVDKGENAVLVDDSKFIAHIVAASDGKLTLKDGKLYLNKSEVDKSFQVCDKISIRVVRSTPIPEEFSLKDFILWDDGTFKASFESETYKYTLLGYTRKGKIYVSSGAEGLVRAVTYDIRTTVAE